jgi:transcriptional regulator with XRE-family HTH domain
MATIRELRDQARLTPSEIEVKTGGVVKKGALNAIERGMVTSPRYELVAALAAALNVPAHTCHTAIAATVAAKKKQQLPRRGVGRPPATPAEPPITLESAAAVARQLSTMLEELTTSGGR